MAGSSIILHAIGTFSPGQPLTSALLQLLAIADGALLLAGLWTPLAGLCIAAFTMLDIFILHQQTSSAIPLATIGVALALVGPGAWSLDAWLFGWKRIDIGD